LARVIRMPGWKYRVIAVMLKFAPRRLARDPRLVNRHRDAR
jgi:hypothetical protein